MAEPFHPPRRTATLEFDEGPLMGAEIEVEVSLDPATYWAVKQWFGQLVGGETKDDKMAANRELAELFGPRLIAWNLVHMDDTPIPPTPEEVRALDIVLLSQIVSLWHRMLGSVPFPLPAASTPGPEQTTGRPRKPKRSTAGSSGRASSPRRLTGSPTSDDSSASSLAASG